MDVAAFRPALAAVVVGVFLVWLAAAPREPDLRPPAGSNNRTG